MGSGKDGGMKAIDITNKGKKEDLNTFLAEQLLALVKWHKDTCDREDCSISLYPFFDLYKSLGGKPDNFKSFI